MGKPNTNPFLDNNKAIHPNSRKAKKLNKKFSRSLKLQKRRGESNMKLQILGDKLKWFKDNMDPDIEEYSPSNVLDLIQRYINRNMDELEQINLKQSIGSRSSSQHASRKDRIKITQENEMNLFTGAGLETIDFLNLDVLKSFKSWNGQLRYLTNFKLRRFKKQSLSDGSVDPVETAPPSVVDESEIMDEDVESEDNGDENGDHVDDDDMGGEEG